MKQIKQNFAVTLDGAEKAYRYVIAGDGPVAHEMIIDYIETNWGGEYGYIITGTEVAPDHSKTGVYH